MEEVILDVLEQDYVGLGMVEHYQLVGLYPLLNDPATVVEAVDVIETVWDCPLAG